MSTREFQEYSQRAEECLRLAGACIAESNRQLLLYAAVQWRRMAEEVAPAKQDRAAGQTKQKTSHPDTSGDFRRSS